MSLKHRPWFSLISLKTFKYILEIGLIWAYEDKYVFCPQIQFSGEGQVREEAGATMSSRHCDESPMSRRWTSWKLQERKSYGLVLISRL